MPDFVVLEAFPTDLKVAVLRTARHKECERIKSVGPRCYLHHAGKT